MKYEVGQKHLVDCYLSFFSQVAVGEESESLVLSVDYMYQHPYIPVFLNKHPLTPLAYNSLQGRHPDPDHVEIAAGVYSHSWSSRKVRLTGCYILVLLPSCNYSRAGHVCCSFRCVSSPRPVSLPLLLEKLFPKNAVGGASWPGDFEEKGTYSIEVRAKAATSCMYAYTYINLASFSSL